MCFIADYTAREANIVSTSQSSPLEGHHQLYPASNLLNGKGLNGKFGGDNCVATNYGPTQWVSFELEAPEKLSSIQITPRLDCCPERSQNFHVSIGPSKSYDPNEPLCLPVISKLVLQEGLTEYKCTGKLHEGKYVKITRGVDGSDGLIDICEVKIFTVGGNRMLLGEIILGLGQL